MTEAVPVEASPMARAAGGGRRRGPMAFVRRHPTVAVGLALIAVMAVVSALAPHLGTVDPIRFSPAQRLRPPSDRFWFGTDSFGRDVYSRTMYGGRISLTHRVQRGAPGDDGSGWPSAWSPGICARPTRS